MLEIKVQMHSKDSHTVTPLQLSCCPKPSYTPELWLYITREYTRFMQVRNCPDIATQGGIVPIELFLRLSLLHRFSLLFRFSRMLQCVLIELLDLTNQRNHFTTYD